MEKLTQSPHITRRGFLAGFGAVLAMPVKADESSIEVAVKGMRQMSIDEVEALGASDKVYAFADTFYDISSIDPNAQTVIELLEVLYNAGYTGEHRIALIDAEGNASVVQHVQIFDREKKCELMIVGEDNPATVVSSNPEVCDITALSFPSNGPTS